MLEFSPILVAIGLGDEHQKIILQAIALSNNDRSNIHLIHACEHPITGYGEMTGKNHYCTEAQIRQQVYPKLKSICEQHNIPNNNLHIDFGRPADTVKKLAKKLKIKLIITGSHGKHGLQLLLGSTANSIVHSAECDVLTVRI